MGYYKKKISIKKEEKLFKIIMENLDVDMRVAQKIIDKKRVSQNGEILLKKTQIINEDIEVFVYKPEPVGLKPIYENKIFAIFDKPAHLLVHPKNLSNTKSLNDEIKYLYGIDANVVNRIDKETSGLVLVSKTKKFENELKKLFEQREVYKEYLALVKGFLKEELIIDEPLKIGSLDSIIQIKSFVNVLGKKSVTKVIPIEYNEQNNTTLVRAIPKTGRQHQIRAHLFHVKHPIVGDPIYGIDEDISDKILSGIIKDEKRVQFTNSTRLNLHSNVLSFEFLNEKYSFKSNMNVYNEFEILKSLYQKI